MYDTYSFGEWIKLRRQDLRRTQRELASSAFCSLAMIKKIEADERRPSRELAQALAVALEIPANQHDLFVRCGRGEASLDRLALTESPASLSPHIVPQLPQPTTPFVGRKAELADLNELLSQPDCRLLTLLGPGGIGKTRLAIEAARAIQHDFHDGALFVPLSYADASEQVPLAIAQNLHVPLAGSDPPSVQIQRLLSRRHLLLLLDNFEQLISGAGFLVELLASAPRVKIVLTSRERLNLVEEYLYPVPPLAEATLLFYETALRVKPDFDGSGQAVAMADICHMVAGHPLAVELAASWARFMTCPQIKAQIAQDLDFLASSARNLPERHKSLRAVFDQSWNLLAPLEKRVLTKLTVFRGGFTAEQAKSVANASWPLLSGLADKSLLAAQGNGRFDMHPLIQQYALTKLNEADAKAARDAHFAAFCALAKALRNQLVGPEAVASSRRAEKELDNFRAALNWGLTAGWVDRVLELLEDLFHLWLPGGYWQEGEKWMAQAVAQASEGDARNLCLCLGQLGVFLALQGRFFEAIPRTEQAFAMARRLNDPWCLVFTLQVQGQARRDLVGAMAAFEEAIAICREQGDTLPFSTFLPALLWLQGDRLMSFGLIEEAKTKFEESLARFQKLGDVVQIAYPMGNLGRIALHEGNLSRAHELIAQSLATARRSGSRVGVGDWVFRMGQIHLYQGDLPAAEAHLNEALRLYEEIGNQFGPPNVLSNLALSAALLGDKERAMRRIRGCFERYRRLQADAYRADASANFLVYDDTIESLLHAGLVAYSLGDWANALRLFRFVENQSHGHETIRPLYAMVEVAEAEISIAHFSADDATETHVPESPSLDEILAIWGESE